MRIGVFADTHDHLDNTRHVVALFNREGCELAVFAGDFVSTFVTPPLRRLRCPLIACFGDNDGNKGGLQNGVSLIGRIADGPLGFTTSDGTRILLTHMLRDLRGYGENADVVIYAHTHRADIRHVSDRNQLFINPGEVSGWSYRRPTAAILETKPLTAWLVDLPAPGPLPDLPLNDYGSTPRR